jgi:branched-chain amino acid transport system permease protein
VERSWWLLPTLTLAVPLLLNAHDRRTALGVPAMAIVLVSIVVVSGYGGQISLGQAGFAGLGALAAARLAAGTMPGLPRVPGVLVLAIVPLLVMPVGLLMGWPAIRRRGLFLALTTFAFGVTISRFVFDQPAITSGVVVHPPDAFATDNNFYILEVLCLGVALALVRNLHSGRLGRALTAIRDDEMGAQACGIDVRLLKLLLFAVSSALAALGGALLAMGSRAFDSSAFDPVLGLVWFAVVVVFGIDSASGAVIGAGVLIALDAAAPSGASILVVGVAALLLGRLPGGLVHTLVRAVERIAGNRAGSVPPPSPIGGVRLSGAGRTVARAIHRPTSTGGATS